MAKNDEVPPITSEDIFLRGNEAIDEALEQYDENPSRGTLIGVLEAIRFQMIRGKSLIMPVTNELPDEDDEDQAPIPCFDTVGEDDGFWLMACTNRNAFDFPEKQQYVCGYEELFSLFPTEDVDEYGIVLTSGAHTLRINSRLITALRKSVKAIKWNVPDVGNTRLKEAVEAFEKENGVGSYDRYFGGNEALDDIIREYQDETSDTDYDGFANVMRKLIRKGTAFAIPVDDNALPPRRRGRPLSSYSPDEWKKFLVKYTADLGHGKKVQVVSAFTNSLKYEEGKDHLPVSRMELIPMVTLCRLMLRWPDLILEINPWDEESSILLTGFMIRQFM